MPPDAERGSRCAGMVARPAAMLNPDPHSRHTPLAPSKAVPVRFFYCMLAVILDAEQYGGA